MAYKKFRVEAARMQFNDALQLTAFYMSSSQYLGSQTHFSKKAFQKNLLRALAGIHRTFKTFARSLIWERASP
jgi:hypothetical protein